MISLAMNVYALMYLVAVGLTMVLIFSVIGYFVGRALLRRYRTWRWVPQVGDRVMSKRTGLDGTIDRIDGAKLDFGFYMENNSARNSTRLSRSDLFFLGRPQRR